LRPRTTKPPAGTITLLPMTCDTSFSEAMVHPCRSTGVMPRLCTSNHSPAASSTARGSARISLITTAVPGGGGGGGGGEPAPSLTAPGVPRSPSP
jgi:hypothetical protein